MKSAQSIDGKIGPENGEPLFITCEESRKYGHMLRRDYGAVLVGRQTILKDNPMLNIRYGIDHPEDRPVRIVLDPQLQISVNSKIINSGGNVLIYTANEISSILKKKVESKGGQIVAMPDGTGKIDIDALSKDLYERGICAVLVEGGANTITQFLKNDLWDEYHFFVAPKFIGKNGIDVYDDLPEEMVLLNSVSESEKCGDDIHILYKNKNGVELCLPELLKKQEPSETSEGIRLVRRSQCLV